MGDLMRRWAAAVGAQPRRATQTNPGAILIAEPKIETLKVTFAPSESGIVGYSTIPVTIGADTFSAALGGTYYGGTIDLVSGALTVTHEMAVLSDLSWNVRTGSNGYVFTASTAKNHAPEASGAGKNFCDVFPVAYTTDWANSHVGKLTIYNGTSKSTYLTFTDISTTSALAAWLTENNPHFCYYLASPETVQLTPQSIAALRGMQTVTSGAGSVEISYYTV